MSGFIRQNITINCNKRIPFIEQNIQNEYTLAMDKYEQFIDSVEEKEIVNMLIINQKVV